MPLTSIDEICPVRNVAGLTKIRYAPLIWFNRSVSVILVNSNYRYGAGLVFNSGKTWLEFPAKMDTKSLKNSGEKSDQGAAYGYILDAVYPTINEEVIAEMNKMTRLEFMVHAVLPSKQEILLGSMTRGADFSFSSDTKDALGNTIGIGVSWRWDSPKGIINAQML